jgi:hypothetical protein
MPTPTPTPDPPRPEPESEPAATTDVWEDDAWDIEDYPEDDLDATLDEDADSDDEW